MIALSFWSVIAWLILLAQSIDRVKTPVLIVSQFQKSIFFEVFMKSLSLLNVFFTMLAFASVALMPGRSVAQGIVNGVDTRGDVHVEGESCQKVSESARAIDIRSVSITNDLRNLYVTIEVQGPIKTHQDFREFYFWIDTNGIAGSGYSPYRPFDGTFPPYYGYPYKYDPDSQAWTNFFADYRVYFSMDEDHQVVKLFQECAVDHCAKETGSSYKENYFAVSIAGSSENKNLIQFTVPLKNLKLEGAIGSSIQFGFTTYFERHIECEDSGEDDFPNWEAPAFRYQVQ